MKDLQEFISQISGFSSLSHPEKVKILGWFLHTYEGKDRFTSKAIRDCYTKLDYEVPNLSREVSRLKERRPPELLEDSQGLRLEARIKSAFNAKYGETQTSISVSKLLADLPAKVPGVDEQDFLREAIACYKVKAFRACVIMSWNLSFNHLLKWILQNPDHLLSFNAGLLKRFPKKSLSISKHTDFEDLKESETIEALNSSNLVSNTIIKVLQKELSRRNMAAHPSPVTITQHQAEDTISDLILNVLLKL